MNTLKTTCAALAACATLAAPAQANPANVERVTEGLIVAGMAIELGDKCGGVRVRMIRGLNFLQGLKSHLQSLGYSNAEIDAYIDNRAEKDRLEAIARQRLTALGVNEADAASYCAVAQGQIAAGTAVGRLLR